jgi:hypothetical protein
MPVLLLLCPNNLPKQVLGRVVYACPFSLTRSRGPGPDLLRRGEAFRSEVRAWLEENSAASSPACAAGPGREHEAFDERVAWDRHLAAAGWTCLGWPQEHGGRGLGLLQQVVFHEEYAKANAPARVSHIGEELLGPTLIAFGAEEQKQRFLPGIRNVTDLWCQGYSEPGAGSDLASVSTRARIDGDSWVIDGQKVWTSLAHVADWCFVIARTEPGSNGTQVLLPAAPMTRRRGVRPIEQLTGTRAQRGLSTAPAPRRPWWSASAGPGRDGHQVRAGVSTIGQQVGRREPDGVVAPPARTARSRTRSPRQLVRARMAGGHAPERPTNLPASPPARGPRRRSPLVWPPGTAASASRYGGGGRVVPGGRGAPYDLDSSSDSSSSPAPTPSTAGPTIQRNIISERVLGLPRLPP